MKVVEDIGTRIRYQLDLIDKTQKELAKEVGVTEVSLSRYIAGEREPKGKVLLSLAKALGTTTDYLLRGEIDPSSFEETYRLVARGTVTMSDEERLKIMKVLLKNG